MASQTLKRRLAHIEALLPGPTCDAVYVYFGEGPPREHRFPNTPGKIGQPAKDVRCLLGITEPQGSWLSDDRESNREVLAAHVPRSWAKLILNAKQVILAGEILLDDPEARSEKPQTYVQVNPGPTHGHFARTDVHVEPPPATHPPEAGVHPCDGLAGAGGAVDDGRTIEFNLCREEDRKCWTYLCTPTELAHNQSILQPGWKIEVVNTIDPIGDYQEYVRKQLNGTRPR